SLLRCSIIAAAAAWPTATPPSFRSRARRAQGDRLSAARRGHRPAAGREPGSRSAPAASVAVARDAAAVRGARRARGDPPDRARGRLDGGARLRRPGGGGLLRPCAPRLSAAHRRRAYVPGAVGVVAVLLGA